MTDFVTTLKLAEKAREDIYFEKLNRELIEALHQQTPRKEATTDTATSSSADTDKHA